jgi:hypothetical protein
MLEYGPKTKYSLLFSLKRKSIKNSNKKLFSGSAG